MQNHKHNIMRETSDEKIAIRGIISVTALEIIVMLFFIMINGGF